MEPGGSRGTCDMTGERHPVTAKPEGVGSEFADVFIRLLDDAWLFGKIDRRWPPMAAFAINDSFPANRTPAHHAPRGVHGAGG